jgi:WD40 repeat protein
VTPTIDTSLITVSKDKRYEVYLSASSENENVITLDIRDTQAGQTIKYLTSDAPKSMRTYSGIVFVPQFFGENLFFLRGNSLYRWSPTMNKETLLLQEPSDISISPDGEYALTYYQLLDVGITTTFDLYDLGQAPARLMFTQTIPGTSGWLSVAFSPDNKSVATGGNSANTRIWDIASNGMIYSEDKTPSEYQEQSVLDLAYSPDGRYLSGCVQGVSFGHAFLRDVKTQKDAAVIKGSNNALYCGSVTFHPHDNTIAFGEEDGSIRIWNIDDLIAGKEISVDAAPQILRGHNDLVTSLAFNHDGSELVSTSTDKTGRVWDYSTGKTITVLNGHNAPVLSAAFNPFDNTIATSGKDGILQLWDIQKQTNIILESTPVQEGIYSPSTISDLEFSPDGTVLAEARLNGDINLWDVQNRTKLATVNGGRTILHITFNSIGTLLVSASSNDTSVRLWGIPQQ